jgi:hypothetical protein
MSLVLRSSMVTSVDVTPFLEGIDTSVPASVHAWRDLVLSLVALPPYLVIGLTTLLPLGFCTHCFCCQVLAINGLLCRTLAHLNASPHHMMGCEDLDLLLWISLFSY